MSSKIGGDRNGRLRRVLVRLHHASALLAHQHQGRGGGRRLLGLAVLLASIVGAGPASARANRPDPAPVIQALCPCDSDAVPWRKRTCDMLRSLERMRLNDPAFGHRRTHFSPPDGAPLGADTLFAARAEGRHDRLG